ncbi:putative protein kinase RLK-Pelle-CrRLK1L-1 family [Helianthus annuus]|nr:putative protein kinase RLK-Pelle-CrRLK1L-1 family [Helianthus annuus]
MSFMRDFDHLKIQMKDVVLATNNFDATRVIGSGGFGKVYKGELSSPEGQITYAFKRLNRRLGQGNVEFWKEIMMLSKYKHKNLISLVHFCIEGDEMILVYEYASRGSLDRYLPDASTLTWTKRLKISVGMARGLHYLHDPKGSQQRVLHRDIKSANILLDENWMAKVSDFGLSKVGPANQAHSYLVSHAVGTPGYCDPLYFELGCLSKESDVYSFGVVLFEILCGRLCYEYCNSEVTKILVPKWRRCYREKRIDEIILPGLKEQMDAGSLKSFSAIAYQCVKKVSEKRPTMAEIVKELELSLKQQEIFEHTHESSQREGTSLILNGQMDQLFDAVHRLKFKSRFQDRSDDHYYQPQDGDESDDPEGNTITDAEGRLRKKPMLWEKPDEEFEKVFRMSKATFNMICDELYPDFEGTMQGWLIPVSQRVAICLYRLATGHPWQTVSNLFRLDIIICRQLVSEVCAAIWTILMPKVLRWPGKKRLERIKTEFVSISSIANIAGSIYTTQISITTPETNYAAYFNKEHSEQNEEQSYPTMVQCVVDSRGVITDICIGPGSMPVDKILKKSYLAQRFNTGQLKNIFVVGGSNYPPLDWLLVPHSHNNKSWIPHSFNEKIGKVQRIAKAAVMRLKGRWTCLQKRIQVEPQDLLEVVMACCILHNICEIYNEAFDEDLVEV